jgi:hypothetical protein
MWKAIKEWFKDDYELVLEAPGDSTSLVTGTKKTILYQFYYSKREKKYKVYYVDFRGQSTKIENPACVIYEARKNGYVLP